MIEYKSEYKPNKKLIINFCDSFRDDCDSIVCNFGKETFTCSSEKFKEILLNLGFEKQNKDNQNE